MTETRFGQVYRSYAAYFVVDNVVRRDFDDVDFDMCVEDSPCGR